ncbi:MAG: 6-phosphogluconolactonase [Acidobacteriota bacterium]
MILRMCESKTSLSQAAAEQASAAILRAISSNGCARILVATGASQFEFLEMLTSTPGIDWSVVEMFHLDEYIGLPIAHRASFRQYLIDRFIEKTDVLRYHLLDGEGDLQIVIATVSAAIASAPIDIAFVGIGENGHLAFNDPPADFETEAPYIIVNLDEACRLQQVGEGWFANLDEVPTQAISISIRQIMKAREIICIAPEARKASAVKACFEGEISPAHPASILGEHPHVTVYLDRESASLLDPALLG